MVPAVTEPQVPVPRDPVSLSQPCSPVVGLASKGHLPRISSVPRAGGSSWGGVRGQPGSGAASLNRFSRQPSRAVPGHCPEPWKRRKVLEQSPAYRSLAGRGWIKCCIVSKITNWTPSLQAAVPAVLSRSRCPSWFPLTFFGFLLYVFCFLMTLLLTSLQKSSDLAAFCGQGEGEASGHGNDVVSQAWGLPFN